MISYDSPAGLLDFFFDIYPNAKLNLIVLPVLSSLSSLRNMKVSLPNPTVFTRCILNIKYSTGLPILCFFSNAADSLSFLLPVWDLIHMEPD